MADNIRIVKEPDKVISYFKLEKWTLAVITISGILYNAGMTAGPWFEGQLVQCLNDIMTGKKSLGAMEGLAAAYVAVIFLVQGARYIKRLYVRKFANHINRDMKRVLYHSLVHRSKAVLETEDVGAVMTKAIADVDTCVEGMRKFTTEVFDTGVVMVAYLVMLLAYDWRLTLLSLIFPPIAYGVAEKLKGAVSKSAAAYKQSAGVLNGVTYDRVGNALTYRVYGQEKNRDEEYETCLKDYEKKAVRANIWETAMQPLYQIISMMSVIFILWFGGKNVLGSGWSAWDIAAFTTFLSCFTKLAVKSSKAAKLFNAVQKARVSWNRIKPFMEEMTEEEGERIAQPAQLFVSCLKFAYPDGKEIFRDVSFTAKPGEVIGLTGPVACGKSTLGKVLLGEYPYEGSIRFGQEELSDILQKGWKVTGYMGHDPELINASLEENVLLGKKGDAMPFLQVVRMDEDMEKMADGVHTPAGNGGARFSGGQQARIALARTLCQKRPLIVLDDPFSAVDLKTEREIMENLREICRDSIVIILTHRLTMFPQMDQVLWLEDGRVTAASHAELMRENEAYARLYRTQTAGGKRNET